MRKIMNILIIQDIQQVSNTCSTNISFDFNDIGLCKSKYECTFDMDN